MADLEELAGALLVQCRPSEARAAAEVAGAHAAGLVLTAGNPEPVVEDLRAGGFTGPILCDAGRYSGSRRIPASRGIRQAWVRRQHALGLVALTDSGYLAPRDLRGLRTILRAARELEPPVIAMLPMAARWFATDAIVDTLLREIDRAGVPVAVAIEHRRDPFGAQYVLRGWLRLVKSATVPVLLLRSNVSALGALCHGAHAAAVGTSSSLRRLYPLAPYNQPPPPGVSAFVTPLLGYHRLETLARIPELSELWKCECPVCSGRTPGAREAFRHSLHAQLRLRGGLHGTAWHERCGQALFLHQRMTEVIPGWRPPDGVRSWYQVTATPEPAN